MADGNSQDKILYQLKRLGPLSAKELGRRLEITTMGARQHLTQLEADQLVTTTPEQSQGRGRPVKSWKLTEKGHQRFPDGHAQVTSDLLISITNLLGESALDRLIEERTAETYSQYSSALQGKQTLKEKLTILAEVRTAEGYMAEVEDSGTGYRLLEHHCPICIAAKTCQGFCRSELEVFQKLLADHAEVQREEHLIAGARRCSYLVTPL